MRFLRRGRKNRRGKTQQKSKGKSRPSDWHGKYDDDEWRQIDENWPETGLSHPSLHTQAAPEAILPRNGSHRRGDALP